MAVHIQAVITRLQADISRLTTLAQALEKSEEREDTLTLTRLVSGRLALERVKGQLERCSAFGAVPEIMFRGEVPIGGYRRAVVFDETGAFVGSSSSLGVQLRPVDQLLFYVQRSGTSKKAFALKQDGKGDFSLDTSQTPIVADASWVLERIAEGSNIQAGKDLSVSFQTVSETGVKEIRKTAIPVLESTRWRVTTGLYFSPLLERTLLVSNEQQDVGTPAQPNRKNLIAENVQRGRLSAGVFVTYFINARTTKPGRPIRLSNFVPGIVMGARLPNPTKEVMLGVAVEPVRGFQLMGGWLWGTQTFAEGQETVLSQVGKPLLAPEIPKYERFGTRSGFWAVTLDVSTLGSTIQKLIEKF